MWQEEEAVRAPLRGAPKTMVSGSARTMVSGLAAWVLSGGLQTLFMLHHTKACFCLITTMVKRVVGGCVDSNQATILAPKKKRKKKRFSTPLSWFKS